MLNFNRNLDNNNLKNLKTSMEKRNLLPYNPIIVDSNYNVIDGQHRLQICKELQLPVYYVIAEDYKDHDVILLNINSKKWALNDYIGYHSDHGQDSYNWLEQTAEKYEWTVQQLINCIGNDFGNIRQGTFKIDEDQRITTENVIKRVDTFLRTFKEKTITPKNQLLWITSRACLSSLYAIMQVPKLKPEEFAAKCVSLDTKLDKRPNKKQYLKMFLDIWNFKRSNRINLEDLA